MTGDQIIRGTDKGPAPAQPVPIADSIGGVRITTNPPSGDD